MQNIYNFKKQTNFFKTSAAFNRLSKAAHSDSNLTAIDSQLIDAGVRLFCESIIKHNLGLGMLRVEHIYLIDENNSSIVTKTFGSILNKEKSKRSAKDFSVLSTQSLIHNAICLIAYRDADNNKDLCQDLKSEFHNFIDNQNKVASNNEAKLEPKISKPKAKM